MIGGILRRIDERRAEEQKAKERKHFLSKLKNPKHGEKRGTTKPPAR